MCKISAFFYGTLCSGNSNFHFCRHATSIESATVCGRLYRLSVGYPVLLVPAENILAKGTTSPTRDARTQFERNSEEIDFRMPSGWSEVHRELMTFDNPEISLPPIDALEGCPRYYQRVLIPVRRNKGGISTAWVYIMDHTPPGSTLLRSGCWQPYPRLRQFKPRYNTNRHQL